MLRRYLSDPWSDTEFPFSDVNTTGVNLRGCLEQLYLLKTQNKYLKVLLSIGGPAYAKNFAQPVTTAPCRSKFAASAISLVQNLGLDGLDINWEGPANDTEAEDYSLLLQEVRRALDVYGSSLCPPYNFTLSVACPAGPSNYRLLHLRGMDPHVDFWNLMAYDYTGAWSTEASHQANLFHIDAKSTSFDTQSAVSYYILQGIKASKIVLGMPVYGRSFENTQGLGFPFSDVGNGTWEAGVYDFKALPLPGTSEVFDDNAGASYTYNATKEEFISYDNVAAARKKAAWIQEEGLGGGMWWEASADKSGNESLIYNVVSIFDAATGPGLEKSLNLLLYPNSTYDNIRAGYSLNMTPTVAPVTISSVPSSTLASSSGLSDAQSPSIGASTAVLHPLQSTSFSCKTPSDCPYAIRLCPDGNCACGVNLNDEAVCFRDGHCVNTICSTTLPCNGVNESCVVGSCCNDSGDGHCAELTTGCDSSPAASLPITVPYVPRPACRRYDIC
jgi:chitinase